MLELFYLLRNQYRDFENSILRNKTMTSQKFSLASNRQLTMKAGAVAMVGIASAEANISLSVGALNNFSFSESKGTYYSRSSTNLTIDESPGTMDFSTRGVTELNLKFTLTGGNSLLVNAPADTNGVATFYIDFKNGSSTNELRDGISGFTISGNAATTSITYGTQLQPDLGPGDNSFDFALGWLNFTAGETYQINEIAWTVTIPEAYDGRLDFTSIQTPDITFEYRTSTANTANPGNWATVVPETTTSGIVLGLVALLVCLRRARRVRATR